MHAIHQRQQQFRGFLQTKELYFLGAERGSPRFAHPDRLAAYDGANLLQLLRPFGDVPMIPIERKAMDSDNIHRLQHAVSGEQFNKSRVNGRNAAENNLDVRIRLSDCLRSGMNEGSKLLPLRVQVEVPVRQIIRLVPQHHGFNHQDWHLT